MPKELDFSKRRSAQKASHGEQTATPAGSTAAHPTILPEEGDKFLKSADLKSLHQWVLTSKAQIKLRSSRSHF